MLRKRVFWIIVLVLALLASGSGYYYYNRVYLQAQESAAETDLSTYTVSRGDLTITASGSGTLIPAAQVAAGFQTSGVLTELLVNVGDKVEAGQILARLNNADAQDEVTQAEITLRQAELALADVTQEADPADLAAAQASLSSAKASQTSLTTPASSQEVLAARETLKSAKEALAELLAGPSADAVASAKADLKLAEVDMQTAQAAYDKIAWQADVGTSDEAATLQEATLNYQKAQATYNEAVQGATQEEIASAKATVAQAQAELDDLLAEPDADELAAAQAGVEQAQAELDTLLTGASATDLETAQLDVTQAQLDLDSAKRQLEYTQLVAPIAGTILAIDAEVGEAVSTDAIITLADMEGARMEFWVEEADLASVAPGNAVNIVFEALPDYTFPGQVISVDPELVEVDSTPAVQVYASIDLSAYPITLLSGMNGDVEVVAGEALNAILVPVEALREIGTDQYAVFVVQANGEMEMRPVGVGLKDYVNAEIVSGLEEGEVISLGTQSNSASSTESTGSDTGAEPMMPMGGAPMGGPMGP